MVEVDLSWLERQRWFGGKGLTVAGARIFDAAQIAPSLILALLAVSYASGRGQERYVLALPRGEGLQEALGEPTSARAMLGLTRRRRLVRTQAGAELRGERFISPVFELLDEWPSVRLLTAEQSNTSLAFAEQAILKLIRRVEVGVNPELEMALFCAGASRPSPRSRGTYWTWPGPWATTSRLRPSWPDGPTWSASSRRA